MILRPSILVMLCAAAAAQTSQFEVVPAAFATQDAVSYEWFAGACADLRQQTLVGPSHLQNLVGRSIWGIELRRTAANEVYFGGNADVTVTLSTAPHPPLACSSTYAANVGNDAVQVFTGTVTLPTSPATTGSTVPWTSGNVVQIPFQTPFLYQGGTLCVDVLGQPIPGWNANWWMTDAAFEDLSGTTQEIGTGCGTYGGPNHRWSFVAERSLLPGAYARFWAEGPQNGIALVVFGAASPVPIPLSSFGLNAPGCDLHLLPARSSPPTPCCSSRRRIRCFSCAVPPSRGSDSPPRRGCSASR
jgi:hypothetical protein